MATTFGAWAGKPLTLRRQVSFEATLRLCGLNLLEGGRCLAPLEEFSLSTPGFFTLAGSEWQQGEGNGTLLQYSCLENPMDGGAWWAAVQGVAKRQTRLSKFTFTFHALEKEMATHSSVLAWRIPGTGEPDGLLSLGSH